MTREIIRQIERDYWAEKADPIDMSEIFDLAQKALEQEPIIDKIRTEIGNHCGLTKGSNCRYCSYCHSVMGVREILEIIDSTREKVRIRNEIHSNNKH